jgi:general stress protein 26
MPSPSSDASTASPATAMHATTTLRRLLEGIEIAMLVTREANGDLRSRPMTTLDMSDDGHIYFFASRSSHQVERELADPRVHVVYADPTRQRYVAIAGVLSVDDDRTKIATLWRPAAKIWFKQGPQDPDLVLLNIIIQHADYWESPSGVVTRLIGVATALVTGQTAALGSHGSLDLPH